MKRERFDYTQIKLSPEVEALIKETKIDISEPMWMQVNDLYAKLRKLRGLQAQADIRKKEVEAITSRQTVRSKDIASGEKNLIFLLNKIREKQGLST